MEGFEDSVLFPHLPVAVESYDQVGDEEIHVNSPRLQFHLARPKRPPAKVVEELYEPCRRQ